MPKHRVYRIQFLYQGEVWEVYCRQISQGAMWGFVELEDLLFGERSELVVDPSQEKLKTEFKGVKRVYVPMHAVLRIDEVEKEGAGRITKVAADGSKVTSFPSPIYTPRGDSGNK